MTEFSLPIRIYWEDTDAGGIVYHANYLRFFERARTEWLRSLGYHQSTLREREGGVFIVSEVQLRFLRPARLDDELLAGCRLQTAGQASLVLAQRLTLLHDPATLLCQATVRVGWVDAHTLRPARIPARALKLLVS